LEKTDGTELSSNEFVTWFKLHVKDEDDEATAVMGGTMNHSNTAHSEPSPNVFLSSIFEVMKKMKNYTMQYTLVFKIVIIVIF